MRNCETLLSENLSKLKWIESSGKHSKKRASSLLSHRLIIICIFLFGAMEAIKWAKPLRFLDDE
jgi:hypothetical protein